MATGRSEQEFWFSTPRVISLVIASHADDQENEHDFRKWLAWHIEALHRMKKLPSFNEWMGQIEEAMDDETLYETLMGWAAEHNKQFEGASQ